MERYNLEQRFEVQKVIGRGTYGRIYLAEYRDEKLRDRRGEVAIKRIECVDFTMLNDAMNEILQMQNLHHPNIILYHETFLSQTKGEECVFINIVMELINGGDLQLKFEKKKRINEDFLFDLVEQVSLGLQFLHSKKIIHRDISPKNIMILDHPERNIFKIVDFGFVRKMENSLAQTQGVGTFFYLAPELMEQKRYGCQVDIYSLGAVVFNLMNMNEMQVYMNLLKNTQEEIVRKLKERGYCDSFIRLIMEMLVAEPNERIQASDIVERMKAIRLEKENRDKKMKEDIRLKKLRNEENFVSVEHVDFGPIESDEDHRNRFVPDPDTSPSLLAALEEEDDRPSLSSQQPIPREILCVVFQYLPFHEIPKLSLVCQYWRVCSLLDELWKSHFIDQFSRHDLTETERTQNEDKEDSMIWTASRINGPILHWRLQFFKRFIRRRNLKRGQYHLHELETGFKHRCFALDEKMLVIGETNGKLLIFDLTQNRLDQLFRPSLTISSHHNRAIRGISILRPEGLLLSCGEDSSVQVRDLRNFQLKHELRKSKSQRMEWYRSIFYFRPLRKVFVGDLRFLRIFSLQSSSSHSSQSNNNNNTSTSSTIEFEKRLHISRGEGVYSITLGPKQRRLFIRSGKTIRVVSVYEPYRVVNEMRHTHELWGFAIDKNYLFVGTVERDLLIWSQRGKDKITSSSSSPSPWKYETKRKRKRKGNYRNQQYNDDNDGDTEGKEQEERKYHVIKRYRFRNCGIITNVILTPELVILGFTRGSMYVLDRSNEKKNKNEELSSSSSKENESTITYPVLWARTTSKRGVEEMGFDGKRLYALIWKKEPFLILDFDKPLKRSFSYVPSSSESSSTFSSVTSSSGRDRRDGGEDDNNNNNNNNNIGGRKSGSGGYGNEMGFGSSSTRNNRRARYRSHKYNKSAGRRKKKKKGRGRRR